jgi:hypothetical protein
MVNEEKNGFYKERIKGLESTLADARARENRLSYGRLVTFLIAFLGFALLFRFSVEVAVIWLMVFLFLFGWLVKLQNQVIDQREMCAYLLKINRMELECCQGEFHRFPDGTVFTDKDHPFSLDMDLFGRNSLYQMINRTTSHPAGAMLSSWLKKPASTDEILSRQDGCADLRERAEWRQKLMAVGFRHKDAGNDPGEILHWLDSTSRFLSLSWLRPVCYVLTVFTIAAVVAAFWEVPLSVLFLILIVNFIVNFNYRKDINRIHLQVSKSHDMLVSYSTAISMIENEEFRSARLLSLQRCFRGKNSASAKIKRLSVLVNRLDTRLNILVSAVLNLVFFWDIHLCFMLEQWKEHHHSAVRDWFSSMAEMEVLSSFANLSFNNPGWTFPEIRQGPFFMNAENAGHPLIPPAKRVCNDFRIDQPGRIFLITGSNMSGKSTFLRTMGVNMVLAFAGSVVCATSYVIAPVRLFTCMRISDSLEDNTSTFYAELKRIAMIIREVKKDPDVFLLMDEILHGTNSDDRHKGSLALIRQLVRYHATGMIATHDLALSKLENELGQEVENYNFDVKIDGEELYFDYRLNKGICKSMNASVLMRKMGIEM